MQDDSNLRKRLQTIQHQLSDITSACTPRKSLRFEETGSLYGGIEAPRKETKSRRRHSIGTPTTAQNSSLRTPHALHGNHSSAWNLSTASAKISGSPSSGLATRRHDTAVAAPPTGPALRRWDTVDDLSSTLGQADYCVRPARDHYHSADSLLLGNVRGSAQHSRDHNPRDHHINCSHYQPQLECIREVPDRHQPDRHSVYNSPRSARSTPQKRRLSTPLSRIPEETPHRRHQWAFSASSSDCTSETAATISDTPDITYCPTCLQPTPMNRIVKDPVLVAHNIQQMRWKLQQSSAENTDIETLAVL